MPSHLISVSIRGIRTHEGYGRLYFDAADRTFHEIESQTRLQKGCVLASKVHNTDQIPVIGSAMQKPENVVSCLLPDDVSLITKLCVTSPAANYLCASLSNHGC